MSDGPFRLILDLSRLLSRVLHSTPTGIDRVEMAYARNLLAAAPGRLDFAAVHPAGLYGHLPRRKVLAFLDLTERRWEEEQPDRTDLRRAALKSLAALRPRRPRRWDGGPSIYIQSSPHHLTRPRLVSAILRRERARFVCLVHDLIPLEFPEYARPAGHAQHRRRIETIVANAAGVIANSAATMRSLERHLAASHRNPVTRIAHLGLGTYASAPRVEASGRPYFVVLGTIEPRKNHLLLLNIWRRLAEAGTGAPPPRLVVVGRRGWENEQVVDMLERCPALVGNVEEHHGLPDRAMRALVAGARALVLPSFAEGYGLPVSEALQMGTPVICSDLPALREAGGEVPEFLDPLDGPGWTRAICDYAEVSSQRRAAQLDRLAGWRAPTWREHIETVLTVAQEVAR